MADGNTAATDQKAQLLSALFTQLGAIGEALADLATKVGDPDFDQTEVDDLVLDKAKVKARIAAVTSDIDKTFPGDAEIKALTDACNDLAHLDAVTASFVDIMTKAQAVLVAVPIP